MNPDQNPEVPTDDSGVVPQNTPKPEWPKKIRTLSAVELDRLTIDSEGRFYWDGHPVVAPVMESPPPAPAETRSSEPVDLDALALLDRAARELSGQQHPGVEPTMVVPGADPYRPHDDIHIGDSTAVASLTHVVDTVPAPAYEMTYHRMPGEKVRLRMSFLQSLALALLVIGVLVGAAGIAISGLVTAHDWACRTNLVKQYCPPPPPAAKPPVHYDIPA
jgi:hypothetical protein